MNFTYNLNNNIENMFSIYRLFSRVVQSFCCDLSFGAIPAKTLSLTALTTALSINRLYRQTRHAAKSDLQKLITPVHFKGKL